MDDFLFVGTGIAGTLPLEIDMRRFASGVES
jgi:hypothetical protein